MNTITPNPDGNANLNDEMHNIGTEQTVTEQTGQDDQTTGDVDYRQKFIDSSRGAQQLLDEKKQWLKEKEEMERKLAEKEAGTESFNSPSLNNSTLYPGFEELDPAEQQRLIDYTNTVTRLAREEINKDPALAFAHKQFNESRWEEAFAETVKEFPELAAEKDSFKASYFHPTNVPDNIDLILKDMAKVHLFDKAREVGARQATEVLERVQLEDPTGGDKQPSATRSLEDWQRLAMENPAKFAKMKEQYESDLKSGKLRE